MTRDEQIESIIDELAEPIREAVAWNMPQGADLNDVIADVRANVFDYLKTRSTPVPTAPSKAEAKALPEKTPFRIEHIGTYTQRAPEVMHDRNGQAVRVEAGSYPLMASVAMDGSRVYEGGIVFQGRDERTGEEKTVLEYPSVARVKELARAGAVELNADVKPEMLEDHKQQQKLTETQQLADRRTVAKFARRGGM